MGGGRPAAAGFTLLELLVVIVIIGIVVTIGVLGIGVVGGLDRELARETERLGALLDLALEDAEFQSRDLGLRFAEDRYEFALSAYRVDADGHRVREWAPLEDEFFRSYSLPSGVEAELEIDGRAVSLRERGGPQERYLPQVFLLSSGEISDPFTVRFADSGGTLTWTLEVGPDAGWEATRSER